MDIKEYISNGMFKGIHGYSQGDYEVVVVNDEVFVIKNSRPFKIRGSRDFAFRGPWKGSIDLEAIDRQELKRARIELKKAIIHHSKVLDVHIQDGGLLVSLRSDIETFSDFHGYPVSKEILK